jgi:hypothetical protein
MYVRIHNFVECSYIIERTVFRTSVSVFRVVSTTTHFERFIVSNKTALRKLVYQQKAKKKKTSQPRSSSLTWFRSKRF